ALRAVVDVSKLGEKTLMIDADVIQADGGTRTAAITGAYVAMHDAMNRLVMTGEIHGSPIRTAVAAVSVGIVEGKPVLDLNYEEDSSAEVDMNVVMTSAGEFIEIQSTAERRTFGEEKLHEMLALAKKGIAELVQIQKKALETEN
ncbi:MAG TPA: ribonuclease PH, partial [Candidatus Goldiibacteriota bacterium]|nr:ribonuclease PH [Candidatus Goldiibacteriota bacterium]